MDEISELEKYKELLDSGAISEEEFTRMKQKLLGLKTDEEKEAKRQAERAEALKEIDAMREAQQQKEEAEWQKTPEQENDEPQSLNEEEVNAEQEESAKQDPVPQEQSKPEEGQQEEQVKSEAVQQKRPRIEPENQEQRRPKEAKAEKNPAEKNAKAQQATDREHKNAPNTTQPQETRRAGRIVGYVKLVILWIVCVFLLLFGIVCLALQNTFYILVGVVLIILAVMACPRITSKTRDIPALAIYYRIKVPVVIALVILAFIFLMLG